MNWEQCYQEGRTPWDKGQAHPGLAAALARVGPPCGRVLVPGCGTGHDLAEWQSPGVTEIIGLDVAPAAVAAAQRRYESQADITMVLGDFFDRTGLPGTVDWLWEHTCFCAIPPQRRADYVRSAAHQLRRGGKLLAVFFLNPWDPHEDQTQGPPFGVTPEELDTFFAADFTLLDSWQPTATYPGREGREEMRLYARK